MSVLFFFQQFCQTLRLHNMYMSSLKINETNTHSAISAKILFCMSIRLLFSSNAKQMSQSNEQFFFCRSITWYFFEKDNWKWQIRTSSSSSFSVHYVRSIDDNYLYWCTCITQSTIEYDQISNEEIDLFSSGSIVGEDFFHEDRCRLNWEWFPWSSSWSSISSSSSTSSWQQINQIQQKNIQMVRISPKPMRNNERVSSWLIEGGRAVAEVDVELKAYMVSSYEHW